MKSIILFQIIFLTIIQTSFSQSSVVDFNINPSACIQESLVISNLSTNAREFEFDFCQGDLQLPPISKNLLDLTSFGGSVVVGIDFIRSNGNWYGFLCSLINGNLFRLDFGPDVSNPKPQVINLGNFDSTLKNPQAIRVIKDAENYYVFINDRENKLVRLSIGSSITAAASDIEIDIILTDKATVNSGLDVVFDGNNWFVAITNSFNLTIIKIGDHLSNDKSFFQVLETSNIPNTLIIGDINIVKESGEWYGFIVSINNSKLIRLDFGSNLFNNPTSQDISNSGLDTFNPQSLWVAWENGVLQIFIATSQGNLFRYTLGNLIMNQAPLNDNLGKLGMLTNTLKLRGVRDKSRYYLFSTDWTSNIIFEVSFPQVCETNVDYFGRENPSPISFRKAGLKTITLYAVLDNGIVDSKTKTVNVSVSLSPDILFDNFGVCRNSEILFIPNLYNLVNYSYSFGDSQSSTLPNPAHQYSSAGEYTVQLSVTAENGCNNFTEKTIKIYDPPTSQFDLPSGLICTNNEFTFINKTLDNFDDNLTYEWLVNDVQKSSTRDFNFAFASEGDQQIKLRTSIPGCSDEMTQTLLNVQTGPVVGFIYVGKCEDEAIKFTNESEGSISGYLWDFANGNSSTVENPSENYPSYGNYNVSLHTTGSNGCVSTLTKPVDIYSVPQASFAIDLPPFACSGSLSQFNDLTPSMPDSNIATWAWSFGDLPAGTSSQKNPLYTYSLAGDYSVSLTTTSNFGCSNSTQKTVTIYPSPKADFSFNGACVNQGTQFTDSSTGTIKSWLWSIQSNTYSVKDPVHIFKSAATHTALLTVTGTNNCINQISKNVSVPVPIVADFTSQSTCATKPALFDEINKGGADSAVSWTWYFGDQGSATGSPAQHVYASTGNPSVTMHTTRQSGCVYSITKTIPIVEPPKAQFSVFLNAGAAPFPVDFVNTSLRASSYIWKFGDALNSTSTEFSPSFTYTALGNYTAELTVENALKCTDSYSEIISVVIPQINAAISDFKLEKIPGSDNWNARATIENKSNVALINPEVFLDISGNALISEKIMGVIKPNELITHTFTASLAPRSVDFACAEIRINSDNYFFDNRQCVNVADQFTSQTPYPNPANDELILEWISTNSEPMQVIIYNASGQVISSRLYSPTRKGLNQVKVDVTQLPAGIYFVVYSMESKTQNFRFSIIR